MLNVVLDPPSGQSDSYWDIRFEATFEYTEEECICTIFNLTTGEQLEILGVTSGYIRNEDTAIVTKTSRLIGYFNLFNKDKMNQSLENFASVDLEFRLEHGEEKETFRSVFYNESRSIDGSIIPFDLNLVNHQIDIAHNIPLKANIVCSDEKSFELAVRSKDGARSCHFQVFTRKGRTDFALPSEMLYYDLDLAHNLAGNFNVYWVKPEGRDFSGLVNRKYILIQNSAISFNSKLMLPEGQSRRDPVGIDLSDEFVISDRYYVHTFKEFSGYSARVDQPLETLSKISRFLHEIQAMKLGDSQIKAFSQDLSPEIRSTMRKSSLVSEYDKKQLALPINRSLIARLSGDYASRAYRSKTSDLDYVTPSGHPRKLTASLVGKSTGGCGCSRKKKNV